nr:putative ribonuclease H-like domain-containing protein [Tanacetum cinerariifolium]
MKKLVKGNLVRGLPVKFFENNHTCVAYQKGKQHKATCKAKLVSSISQPLQMLHMDLFGPTSVMSINHKKYCLVVTDDLSRFSWVFFLATTDETSKVFKPFITAIENQINKKVKVIRCDNGTEFKNRDLDEFYGMKDIKREYSNAKTPQQNKVAKRKNRTLIEAARTMLADSLLPITFWAEAVNTACYVLNRALVIKPHNKTPYELLNGRSPRIDFMRPFGCPVTILNTLDPLGKFKGRADEGFLVGYSVTSKAFRSSISSTYKSSDDKAENDKPKDDTGSKTVVEPVNKEDQAYRDILDRSKRAAKAGSTNSFNTISNQVNAASTSGTFSAGRPSSSHPDALILDDTLLHVDQDDSQIPDL